MLSSADQDYIKAIYSLQAMGNEVTTSLLAGTLGVKPSSVSGMLKKLSETQMVDHNRYKGVRLTSSGLRAALKVIRRHRLIELFLLEILGMPWDLVHQEAEKLEHVISDELEKRIDELLGFPEFDPHGSPIPNSKGKVARLDSDRLDTIEKGQSGVISEVSDYDPELLRYLAELGLIPGVKVTVGEVLSFDGTLIVKIGKREHKISPKVAAAVRVKVN